MRRQNPPQIYLDKAREIEKYLSPTTIALVYGIAGVLYATAVSLVFADLLYESVVKATALSITVFAVIGIVPTILIFLAYFLRPDDPLSSYILRLASLWRSPFEVPADECTFKTRLMDGEAFCVDLAFYYPKKDQTLSVKERLYTYVQGALAKACSGRVIAPNSKEIEEAIDPPLELLAQECNIPVLYLEIKDVYHAQEEILIPVEYSSPDIECLGTGTWE